MVLLRGPGLELLATIEEKKYTHAIKLKDTLNRALWVKKPSPK
jgi:hypothetical protein